VCASIVIGGHIQQLKFANAVLLSLRWKENMQWTTERGQRINLKLTKHSIHRSNRQDNILAKLKKLFPYDIFYEEVRIPETRLSIDILSPSLRVAVEVDSELHEKYNKHYHKDYHSFLRVYKNDTLKNKLCAINGLKLIRLDRDEYSNDQLASLILIKEQKHEHTV
jgi:hypothetical protein